MAARAIDPVLNDAKRTFDKARETVRGARDTVRTGRKQAPEIGREARSALDDRTDQVREQAMEAAGYASEQFDQLRELAGDRLEDARIYVLDRVQERPMTSAFAALGAGLLLGLLLAGSRR